MGVGGEDGVVRHEQHGHAGALVDVADQVHQLPSGGTVEVSGGLVREDDGRPDHQRAGDREPLLLAAGEVCRMVARPVREIHQRERVVDAGVDLRLPHAVEDQRHADVLAGGEEREQVERLEDVADAPPAQRGGLGRRHPGDVGPVDQDAAARRRRQPGDQVQDGALSRPARPGERPEPAGGAVEREVVDGADHGLSTAEDLADVAELDHVPAAKRSRSFWVTSSSQASSARTFSSAPSMRSCVTNESTGLRAKRRRWTPSTLSSRMYASR